MRMETHLSVSSDIITPGSLKQGYLHIKRERSSSPIAARVLFKPWQQAYFILRQDPFILEEYKDASLKTQKQIHFIGTIKHVGKIRTSKSKQFAFEVVMCEKTPLLLACDNEILMDEWIHAFKQIMNVINEMRTRRKCHSTPNLYAVDQKENTNVTFEVEIVETVLSNANNLHGDYLLVMSPTRISVMEQEEYIEALSWPLSHMTFYKCQAGLKRVIFVMGRNCHFGCGKLTFETKQCEPIINFVKKYHPKITERSTSSSFSSNSSSIKSDGSYKKMSQSFTEGTSLQLEESYEKPVFDSPIAERKKSISVTDAEENNNDMMNNDNENSSDHVDNSQINGCASESNKMAFPEISSEDSYILPDESKINEKWRVTHSNFSRFSRERAHVLSRSRQNSDPENEPTSYLQILAEEEEVEISSTCEAISNNPENVADEDDMQKLLKSITSSLENPKHSENILETIYTAQRSENVNYTESRRSSEPWKKKMSSIDKDMKGKLQTSRGTQSLEASNNIVDHIRSSPNNEFPGVNKNQSPNSSPKISSQRQDGFLKQNSISNKTQFKNAFNQAENHFNPKTNPFRKAESFFNRPLPSFQKKTSVLSMRRNQTNPSLTSPKSPELDRNTKPKTGTSSGCNSETHSSVSSNDDESEVQAIIANVTDEPPPLPERTSPKNHRSSMHQTLCRTSNFEEHEGDEILPSNGNDCNVPRKISFENAEIAAKNLLAPPPLPPKSKILSSTKSAPLSGSNDEKEPTHNQRRLSYESIKKSKDTPPEVPVRDYSAQPINTRSTSEGNLLSVEEAMTNTPPRTPTRNLSPNQSPKPVNKNPLSKSLDGNQLAGILSVTVTNYEEVFESSKKRNSSTFEDTHPGIVPIKSLPKSLTHGTLPGFPKAPKTFY